jgi:ribosomal protein S27AE
MFHRLPPLPNFQVIDTLTEMRRCAANVSNRLDYLTKTLVGAGKFETSTGLWLKAMNADKKAIREMVEYNKVDVIRNEQLYKIMKPYMKSHPHMGAIAGHDRNLTCPKCGSGSFDSSHDKLRYTAAGLPRIQKQCSVCHSYTTFK